MLSQDSIRGNATVTSTHVKTRDLRDHTARRRHPGGRRGRAPADPRRHGQARRHGGRRRVCIAPLTGLVGDVAHRRGRRGRGRDHPRARRGRSDDGRDAAGEHRVRRGAAGLHSVTLPVGGGLAAILRSGAFAVTGEIAPPRSADGTAVTEHARGQVGYVDAVNVTDNPAAIGAHVRRRGRRLRRARGHRDRPCSSRSATATGSRSRPSCWEGGRWAPATCCASPAIPLHVGDHPDADVVNDIGPSGPDAVSAAACARRATTLGGAEIADPPRYLIGCADMPLADPYDPARLEVKLDAGADVIWTQITYDVEALAAWADTIACDAVSSNGRRCWWGWCRCAAPAARGSWTRSCPACGCRRSIIDALESAGDGRASAWAST